LPLGLPLCSPPPSFFPRFPSFGLPVHKRLLVPSGRLYFIRVVWFWPGVPPPQSFGNLFGVLFDPCPPLGALFHPFLFSPPAGSGPIQTAPPRRPSVEAFSYAFGNYPPPSLYVGLPGPSSRWDTPRYFFFFFFSPRVFFLFLYLQGGGPVVLMIEVSCAPPRLLWFCCILSASAFLASVEFVVSPLFPPRVYRQLFFFELSSVFPLFITKCLPPPARSVFHFFSFVFKPFFGLLSPGWFTPIQCLRPLAHTFLAPLFCAGLPPIPFFFPNLLLAPLVFSGQDFDQCFLLFFTPPSFFFIALAYQTCPPRSPSVEIAVVLSPLIVFFFFFGWLSFFLSLCLVAGVPQKK